MINLRPRRGIRLPVEPAGAGVLAVVPPRRLVLPLRHGRLDLSTPLVSAGDRVLAGQPLSTPVGLAARAVHSPMSGTVSRVSVQSVSLPANRGAPAATLPLPCVELEDLQAPRQAQGRAWRQLERPELAALLGSWGLEGADGMPLDLELQMLPVDARLLILGVAPAQALWTMLLETAMGALASAVAGLCRLHGFREAVLLCPPQARVAAGRLTALLEKVLPVACMTVKQGHPWDHPRLAALAAGWPLPSPRRSLAAQGVLAIGLDRLLRVDECLTHEVPTGLPMMIQPYRSAGGLPEPDGAPILARVWPGTPLEDLMSALLPDHDSGSSLVVDGSLFEGSPMLNPRSPLLPGHALLSLLPRALVHDGGEEACISCGLCLDLCPMRLAPIRLVRLIGEARLGEARDLGLEHCLDCGLCSWVCPSRIELGHGLRKGLHQVREGRHGA